MTNKFREFVGFIHEMINCRPPEFEGSFKDVFIYIPDNKIPPKKGDTCSPGSRGSLKIYFAKWNRDFFKLVYDEDWEILESIIGYELFRFCLADCIFAKQTKVGGLLVSKLSELKDKLPTNPHEKLNQIFYTSATLKGCGKEIGTKSATNDNNNSFHFIRLFSSSDFEISSDDCLFKTSKSKRFPKDHILVEKNEKTSITKEVIKTCVGNCRIVGYENCIEKLEKIFQQLKRDHGNYNYNKSLNHLLISKRETRNQNDKSLKNELPIPVLKKYFANICSYVIPEELFGSNKNRNTMIKIVCDLLDVPYRQSINLRPYMLKIKVSDMRWLDRVTDDDTRWTIVGKLLKWLFVNFILEIFRTQFYIMITTTSKKIYFKQSDWQKSTTDFVRKMCNDNVIENVNGIHVEGPCVGKWMLFPKKNGLRPIMALIKGSKIKEITKQTLHYLQQLYTTKYGDFRKLVFVERWRNLIEKYQDRDKRPLYVVCCDIESAYESIDQKKLIEIVESFADLTGPSLRLKYYKIAKDLRALKSICFNNKSKWFVSYPKLELPITKGSVFARVSEKSIKIKKETLLREMRSNVRNQHILIRNQRYLLRKGIAQGAILSSVLCDMYYAHMIEAKLSRFKEEGFLYRYVDDFLFVTEDKALAEEFLEHVKTGFPEYNCTFTPAKTRTNLPCHRNTEQTITYLGYNINLRNFEVTLDYSKSSKYTTIASKPLNNILLKFRTRLCNLASLKLDELVLDSKINSEETIVKTIKRAFTRQAERCLWLLKSMFDDISKHVDAILKIIKSTNIQIFRRIRRYFIANGYDFEKLVPRLAVIPWKSYRQVFGKIQTIHEHFRVLFLVNIKMTSKLAVELIDY